METSAEARRSKFISVVGNKPVTEISRNDMLRFRDWWIERIKDGGLVTNSSNKDFIHLKTILETTNKNLKL